MNVRFFVPERGNAGQNGFEAASRLVSHLCEQYGGATVHLGGGNWVSPEGQLAAELVFIVESAIPAEKEPFALAEAKGLAGQIKLELTQESVMFQFVPSDTYFV
ncbi:MAG: hypothetical protein C4555_06430 [Dehalococcoidia bacterium]|nr:MAG: hypothetical protein C4555_06430 [Dehalococcoidia bacterium]